MKKYYFFLMLFVFVLSLYGQDKKESRPFEKIEQLEKAKLIEVLDLDEETAVKFFARRNEHHKVQRDLMRNRQNLLEDLEKNIKDKVAKDPYYTDQVNKIFEIEKQMSVEKQSFIRSLNDILNSEQIAKFTVFEFKFRREIAQSLMGRKRPKD